MFRYSWAEFYDSLDVTMKVINEYKSCEKKLFNGMTNIKMVIWILIYKYTILSMNNNNWNYNNLKNAFFNGMVIIKKI